LDDKIKEDDKSEAQSMHETPSNAYKMPAGMPGRKSSLIGPRHRLMDNIIKELKERWWTGVHCIHLAQDRAEW
jgi:hypothetical protein